MGDDTMQRRSYWHLSVVVTLAAAFGSAVVNAQPPGGRGGFGGPFGGGGTLGLVMREEVQQELQIVDEQREQVEALADETRDQMRDEMRDLWGQLRDLSEEERRAKFDEIRGRMEAMNADLEGRLKKVLLPHQFERLKQIDVQVRVQQRGASALTSGDVAEALNLSDEQREKLEQRAEEVQQELRDKMRELQLEARNKMLEVLTTEQRAKLDELMGDAFELREGDSRFGRGGFFGGRRGRDSDRGRDGDRGRDRQSGSGNEAI
jgi:Spy/CpxP family protein refolding chaperone